MTGNRPSPEESLEIQIHHWEETAEQTLHGYCVAVGRLAVLYSRRAELSTGPDESVLTQP